MPLEEYAKITRAMIDRENDLIHNRVSWLTTLQGLLFAGLGLAWGKANLQLVLLFAAIGIALSFPCLMGLFYATRATARLLESWTAYKQRFGAEAYTGPDVIGLAPWKGLPRYFTHYMSLPMILISAWIGIAWIAFRAPMASAQALKAVHVAQVKSSGDLEGEYITDAMTMTGKTYDGDWIEVTTTEEGCGKNERATLIRAGLEGILINKKPISDTSGRAVTGWELTWQFKPSKGGPFLFTAESQSGEPNRLCALLNIKEGTTQSP